MVCLQQELDNPTDVEERGSANVFKPNCVHKWVALHRLTVAIAARMQASTSIRLLLPSAQPRPMISSGLTSQVGGTANSPSPANSTRQVVTSRTVGGNVNDAMGQTVC
jgi:hypothetical protein